MNTKMEGIKVKNEEEGDFLTHGKTYYDIITQ